MTALHRVKKYNACGFSSVEQGRGGLRFHCSRNCHAVGLDAAEGDVWRPGLHVEQGVEGR